LTADHPRATMGLMRCQSLPNITLHATASATVPRAPLRDVAANVLQERAPAKPATHGYTIHGGGAFLTYMRAMEVKKTNLEREEAPAPDVELASTADDLWDWSVVYDDAEAVDESDEMWDWSYGVDESSVATAVEEGTSKAHAIEAMSERMWTWMTPAREPRSSVELHEYDMWDWSPRTSYDEKAIRALAGVAYKWYASSREWAAFHAPLLSETIPNKRQRSESATAGRSISADEMWDWSVRDADTTDAEMDPAMWDWSYGRDERTVPESNNEKCSESAMTALRDRMWTWNTPESEPRSSLEQRDDNVWDWSERSSRDHDSVAAVQGVEYKWYACADDWALYHSLVLPGVSMC